MTKCAKCGKRIWFWQREIVTLTLPDLHRSYYHRKCWINPELEKSIKKSKKKFKAVYKKLREHGNEDT